MEIFNIHIGEFLMIAALALVVFGPERLPEVGRFVGRQVAKLLAWQQQSPEIQMLNDVRTEFEHEIASLRDELVRTRKQLDVSQDMANLRDELRPMLNLRGAAGQAAAANSSAAGGDPTPANAAPPAAAPPAAGAPPQTSPGLADGLAVTDSTPPAPTISTPPQSIPAAARPNKLRATEPTSVLGSPAPAIPVDEPPLPCPGPHGAANLDAEPAAIPSAPQGAASPAAASAEAQQELLRQMHTLLHDLQALVGELQRRDLLGADWQLPSQDDQQAEVGRGV